MKSLTKTYFSLLFLFALAACHSGEKELVYSLDESDLKVEVWQFKRSIIEEQFAAKSDINMKAKGSLAYVLTNTHNALDADLDISKLKNKNTGIELNLETVDVPIAKEKINQIIANFTSANGHEVFYGEAPVDILLLKVADVDLLNQHQYTENNGLKTSVKRINKSIDVKGTLADFVKTLNKNILSTPLEANLPDQLSEKLFTIQMTWDDGFEQAFDALEKNYGLSVEKHINTRKILRIQ